MKRIFFASLIATLAALAGTDARLRAECPIDDRVDGDVDGVPADRRGADMPAAPLEVHEWGVWRLGPNGRVASLEELVRESPSFVHRADGVAGPELGPPIEQRYEICDKPVIFLHAGTTLDVRVTVQFPTGSPWLHYPAATLGTVVGTRSVRWSGHVLASDALPEGRAYPTTSPTHWWSFLRRAGASPFVSATTTEAERFLFYDGETQFPAAFRIHRRRPTPIPGRADPVAWIVDGRDVARVASSGTQTTRTRLADMPALRVDMRTTLVARGLNEAETDALLDTWRTNLFADTHERVIWMLPRATYDAILPLEVVPTPRSIVRVGVVIQRYGR